MKTGRLSVGLLSACLLLTACQSEQPAEKKTHDVQKQNDQFRSGESATLNGIKVTVSDIRHYTADDVPREVASDVHDRDVVTRNESLTNFMTGVVTFVNTNSFPVTVPQIASSYNEIDRADNYDVQPVQKADWDRQNIVIKPGGQLVRPFTLIHTAPVDHYGEFDRGKLRDTGKVAVIAPDRDNILPEFSSSGGVGRLTQEEIAGYLPAIDKAFSTFNSSHQISQGQWR